MIYLTVGAVCVVAILFSVSENKRQWRALGAFALEQLERAFGMIERVLHGRSLGAAEDRTKDEFPVQD
jgi:hypothetical protein